MRGDLGGRGLGIISYNKDLAQVLRHPCCQVIALQHGKDHSGTGRPLVPTSMRNAAH